MARRSISLARRRAGKRAYRRRQRKEAIKQIAGTLVSLFPGVGIVKTVHDLGKSYEQFRRGRL